MGPFKVVRSLSYWFYSFKFISMSHIFRLIHSRCVLYVPESALRPCCRPMNNQGPSALPQQQRYMMLLRCINAGRSLSNLLQRKFKRGKVKKTETGSGKRGRAEGEGLA